MAKKQRANGVSGNPSKRAAGAPGNSESPFASDASVHVITAEAAKRAEQIEADGGPARMSTLTRAACSTCGGPIDWVSAEEALTYGMQVTDIAKAYDTDTDSLDVWMCCKRDTTCTAGGVMLRHTHLHTSIDEHFWHG